MLLYAFLQSKLSDDHLLAYAQSSIHTKIEFKDQITTDDTYLRFQRGISQAQRGSASYQFRETLILSGLARGSVYNIESKYILTLEQVILKSDTQMLLTDMQARLQSGKSESGWAPYSSSVIITTAQAARLPSASPGEQAIYVEYHFTLNDPNGKTHKWISSAKKVLTRTENPVQATFIQDREALAQQLELIQISDLLLPSDPEAIGRSGEGGTLRGIFKIYNQTEPPLGLCGEVWFRSGEERIIFGTSWFLANQISGVGGHSVQGFIRWWEYFIEHKAFWDQVQTQGKVDVLVFPNHEVAERYVALSSTDRIVDQPVIFRDVPVRFYQAISNEPWDRSSPRYMAMSGRNEEVGVVRPELFDDPNSP